MQSNSLSRPFLIVKFLLASIAVVGYSLLWSRALALLLLLYAAVLGIKASSRTEGGPDVGMNIWFISERQLGLFLFSASVITSVKSIVL